MENPNLPSTSTHNFVQVVNGIGRCPYSLESFPNVYISITIDLPPEEKDKKEKVENPNPTSTLTYVMLEVK